MTKLKYALTAMLMIFCVASLTYGGQNSGASVTVDLYSAAPTTTSDQGNSTITDIDADTDIYVKVYLNDVSNLFLYYVELLIDPNKLTWEKYGLSDGKPSLTGEVNIINKEQTDFLAVYGGATVPGTADGIYTKVKVGAYMSVNRSVITDPYAADGKGLAAVIKLKTKSTFTSDDRAEIIVKQAKLEDNGQPSSVVEFATKTYYVAGVINPDTTEVDDDTDVETTTTSDTATIALKFKSGATANVKFQSGTGISGKTVTVRNQGTSLPDSLLNVLKYKAVKNQNAARFRITSNIATAFTSQLRFKYTNAGLAAMGITNGSAAESRLIFAYLNAFNAWQRVAGTVDTLNNRVTATVTHFSEWAVVDSNNALVVPVEMSVFTARVDAEDGVVLEWSTVSETNNYGFYIERSVDNVTFEEVGFVKGSGTSYDENIYAYIDTDALSAGQYYYRLKQVDYDGTYEYSSIVKAIVQAPSNYVLSQAYPNPFNPTTTIEFSLKESGFVKLMVYNTLGQEVARLVNDNMVAGKHKVMFDAKNLASGMYIYKINVNGFTSARKIVLMK